MSKDSGDRDENSKFEKRPTRSKQVRRNMLKSLAAGGSIAATSQIVPEKWSKPVLNSTLLPAHAATTGDGGDSGGGVTTTLASTTTMMPPVCTLTGNVSAEYIGGGDTPMTITLGPYALPGDYAEDVFISTGAATVSPSMQTAAGVNDTFSLSIDINTDVNNPADLSQNSVSPNPDGSIPFNSIGVQGNFFNISMTVTPDNQTNCGGPQNINITFTD